MKHSSILLPLAAVLLSACARPGKTACEDAPTAQPQAVFNMARRTAEPDSGRIIGAAVWQQVPVQKGFSAPWSGDKQDQSEFQCYLSPHYLYFRFRVPDASLTLHEPFTKKLDVCDEDRAEIFLSATPGMEQYYSMEIDPRGRTLDYVTSYYRQFDYDWSFSSLQTETLIQDSCYIVAGRLSTAEMLQLGLPLDGFSMGVFRADFDGPQTVVWYSLLRVERQHADFHIPEMLYRVSVEAPQTTAP